MNARQLLIRVCAQLGEERLEVDTEALALAYMNEAHAEMTAIFRPYTEVAAVPEGGLIDPALAGCEAGDVLRVLQDGEGIPFDVHKDGRLFVSTQGPVSLRLRNRAEGLAGDLDAPDLPAAFHGALADYATFRLMAAGGRAQRQRADMFFSRYLQRKASLAPESSKWRDHIANKYG